MDASQKIRVLRIIARMNVGGPAVQVTTIMKSLDKKRFEQLLVVGNCDEGEEEYSDFKNSSFKVIRLQSLGRSINLLEDFKTIFSIRRIIQEFKPQIIHTHTAKAGVLGRFASLLIHPRPKLVHTFHGHLLYGYFSRLKTYLVISIEKLLAYKTDALVAVGDKVRAELLQAGIGSRDKFRVVRPGISVNLPIDNGSMLRDLHISPDDFVILYLGRLVQIKRPERVFEIAQFLTSDSIKFRFLIVGSGPLETELKSMATRCGIQVDFLGWQTNVDIILSISNVLLLTSDNEGTPISIIQAQLAGIPVIATNVGSVQETVMHGRSGFVCNYDPQVMANHIEKLAKNFDLYQGFSHYAQEHAELNFSVANFVKNYSEIYESLIIEDQSNF